jgi:hypothetical protein
MSSYYESSNGSEFKLKNKFKSAGKSELPGGEESSSDHKTNDVTTIKETKQEKEEETNEDANELGAKLIRAELMGDDALVGQLRARLEVARSKKLNHNTNPHAESTTSKSMTKNNGRKGKFSSSNTQIASIDMEQAKMLKRNYHGDEYDDFGEVKTKKKRNVNSTSSSSRSSNNETTFGTSTKDQFKHSINSNDSSLCENCEYCFDNVKKHLVVSIGKYSYLCLPSTESLVDGNCFIVPMAHQSSSVTCDEEIWNEIQDFRRTLVKMFDLKKQDCIFYEQYSHTKKFSHMIIECVPIGRQASNVAPGYFKKALQESEHEFKAQNKQLIYLKSNNPEQSIRNVLPKSMPYFTVNFGLDHGYAHVIENDEAFPSHFAKEVIGGILDLDPMQWRRTRLDDFTRQSKKAVEFLKWWKPFDFNQKL